MNEGGGGDGGGGQYCTAGLFGGGGGEGGGGGGGLTPHGSPQGQPPHFVSTGGFTVTTSDATSLVDNIEENNMIISKYCLILYL